MLIYAPSFTTFHPPPTSCLSSSSLFHSTRFSSLYPASFHSSLWIPAPSLWPSPHWPLTFTLCLRWCKTIVFFSSPYFFFKSCCLNCLRTCVNWFWSFQLQLSLLGSGCHNLFLLLLKHVKYGTCVSVSSRSLAVHESPRWRSQGDAETQSLQLDSEGHTEAPPTLTSTPLKQGYVRFKNIAPVDTSKPILLCMLHTNVCSLFAAPAVSTNSVFICVSSCVSCLSAAAASRSLRESHSSWMMRSSRRSSVWRDWPPQTNNQVRDAWKRNVIDDLMVHRDGSHNSNFKRFLQIANRVERIETKRYLVINILIIPWVTKR